MSKNSQNNAKNNAQNGTNNTQNNTQNKNSTENRSEKQNAENRCDWFVIFHKKYRPVFPPWISQADIFVFESIFHALFSFLC